MSPLKKLFLKYFRPEKYAKWKEETQQQAVSEVVVAKREPGIEVVMVPPPPKEELFLTELEALYLKRYPDVAKHSYYGTHPYEHYYKFGKQEGRLWGYEPQTQVPQNPTVKTPEGREFPVPDERENLMGYIGRVGGALGRGEDWKRVSGTLFLGTDHLVPRNIPRDALGEYKEDRNNWPRMAERFWFPPKQDESGWQQVHDNMQNRGKEQPKPSPLPPDEVPL